MNKNTIKAEITINIDNDQSAFTTSNLFFIKSKHAFKEYKNHDYFQHKPFLNMRQSLATKLNKEFVGSPAPYGVNNAYNYICEEITKNYIQKSKAHNTRLKTQIQPDLDQRTKNYSFMEERKRKSNCTLPNLRESKKEELFQGGIATKNKIIQSIALKFSKQTIQTKTEYQITLIYIDRFQTLSGNENCELRLNIYDYIINTFLKTKINYHEITEKQFDLIKTQIRNVHKLQKEHVDYKDLVNVKSIHQIFQLLELNKDNLIFCQEIYRYFFIATDDIYEYQYNKIKDQVKNLVNFQFNRQIDNQDIYIYNTQSTKLITNLHQLISSEGKFVFGTDPNAIHIYRNFVRDKEAKNKLANRIKKWKSIAPEDQMNHTSFQSITTDKYHKLFSTVQKRRDKFMQKKKPIISLKSSQFIEKDKLFKDEDIFQ